MPIRNDTGWTAKWGGSCFLNITFPSQQRHLKKEFGQSVVRIFWEDQCNDEGLGNRFVEPEELNDDQLTLLLDLSESANLFVKWPDRVEILFPGQTISLDIIFEEEKRTTPPATIPRENQKEREM